MKDHLFSWIGLGPSIVPPNPEWTYLWIDALQDDTCHVYYRIREEQTLDGMTKTVSENLALVHLENSKWYIMIADNHNNPVEMEPGQSYETADRAFVLVENHNFKLS